MKNGLRKKILKNHKGTFCTQTPITRIIQEEKIEVGINERENRGRGKGRGRYNSREKYKKKKNISQIVCFECEKPGHFASVCPEKTEHEQEFNKSETEVVDVVLYMHEIVFLNEEKVMSNWLHKLL